MAKGQAQVLFMVVIMIIIAVVATKFIYGFMGVNPAQQAQKDLQGTIETVCAADGPSASGLQLNLPKIEDVSGNPQFQKLQLTEDGALGLYKCAGTGASCSNNGLQKTIVLSCPKVTKFADCWVSPSAESIVVTVQKDSSGKINLTGTGVICP